MIVSVKIDSKSIKGMVICILTSVQIVVVCVGVRIVL